MPVVYVLMPVLSQVRDVWPSTLNWKLALKRLMLAPLQHVEHCTWGAVYLRLSRNYCYMFAAVRTTACIACALSEIVVKLIMMAASRIFLKLCAGNAEKIGVCRSIEKRFPPSTNPITIICFRYGIVAWYCMPKREQVW